VALVDFIKRAPRRSLYVMTGLALIASIANALLVVAVNEVTEVISAGERPGPIAWGGFVVAFLIYYQGNKMALLRANVVIERLLKELRLSVIDKLRRSELRTVDRLGRGSLYTLVSQESNHLSVTFPLIVEGIQQGILLCILVVYLGYLSPAALFTLLTGVLFGYIAYRLIDRDFRKTMLMIQGRQGEMLDAIGDIIHGAKELRLNQKKSDSVFVLYRKLSRSAENLLVIWGENWASLVLLGSAGTYAMLGVIGFAFPGLLPGFDAVIFQVIPVMLFCLGAATKLVVRTPMFVRADVGLKSILDIDRQLSEAGGVSPQQARDGVAFYEDFQTLAYAGLTFSYRDANDAAVFTAGPLDLSVRRGELVFLVGGNGSGKSTVLRLITGLFPAESGRILVDGTPVVGRAIAGYRELFTAIFVDFHLFERLYGLEHIDPNRVNRMIEEMGLGGKVQYDDGRFTQLALSTGQRKRLALIVALLEDRPVYVFDEWSAEQDAQFREYFYARVLPDLKARGKTVIAVTHDERYWHNADRVVKMDLGRVEWERDGSDLEPV